MIVRFLILLLVFFLSFTTLRAADECLKAAELVQRGVSLADGSLEEEKLYTAALTQCPGLVEAYYNLGLNYTKQNKIEEAFKQFDKASSLNKIPLFLLAKANSQYLLGKLNEAEQSYNQVLDINGQNEKALQGLALIAFSRNSLADAENFLRQAIQINPDDGTVFYDLALVLEKLERREEAIISLETALDKKSRFNEAKIKLAELYYHEGRNLEALNLIEPLYSAKMSPEQALLLAAIYQRQDKVNESRTIYQQIHKGDPENYSALVGIAQLDIIDGKIDIAVAALEKANNDASSNAEILSLLGHAYLLQDKLKEGKQVLDKAYSIDPNNAMTLNNLGVYFELTGDKVKAESNFREALIRSPKLLKAQENLARLTR
ncbi:MAG: tetratricopeptide repeat protein [Deltaproteobacteria bacterium]|nr:tetratricopeptide repeat protein [Deltaproteobacteria bacterium]